ncbi:MAG: response regulator [Myxococcales bacterium]|nr:response regulator [Myxococcales bacterium]
MVLLSLACATASATEFSHDTWGIAEGLPLRSITDLEQAPDGTLLIGTFAGLVRFDGVVFSSDPGENPTTDLRITALRVTSEGHTWIGHQHGQVARLGHPALPDGPNRVVWDLVEHDEHLIAATSSGIWEFGDRWRPHAETGPIRAVTRHAGTAFGAGLQGLFTRDDDGSWHPVRAARGELPHSALASDPGRSVLWVAWADGLGVLTESAWHGVTRPPAERAHLVVDGDRVWEARDRTVSLYDGGDALAALVSDADPEPRQRWTLDGAVRSLFLGREGGLWIGTEQAGLMRLAVAAHQRYTDVHGLPTKGARVVAHIDGELYVGSGCAGLRRLDRSADRFVPVPLDRAHGGCVRTIDKARDGGLWVGVGKRIVHLDEAGTAKTHWHRNETPDGANVVALHDDGEDLWIGTASAGLWRWSLDGEAGPQRVQEVRATHIYDIAPGVSGDLWMGTETGVVHRASDGLLTEYDANQGLAAGIVRDLHVRDDGTVWVATYGGGLGRIRDGRAQAVDRSDGLAEDVLCSVVEDRRGRLWLNGNRGVSRVEVAELEALLDGEAFEVTHRAFSTPEGNGGGSPAGTLDGDGRPWFPTVRGMVVMSGADSPAPPPHPTPRITKIGVDGAEYDVRPSMQAPVGARSLTVEYATSVLHHPERTRYRYRLLPLQRVWTDAGNRRLASFEELPPGTYRLEVQASVGGLWSEAASTRIHIPPMLLERVEIRLILLCTTLLGLFLGFRLRTKTMQQRNEALLTEVRQRKATEQALRVRDGQYRRLFHTTLDAMIVVNEDDVVISTNPAATTMLGYAPDDLRGCSLAQLVLEDQPEQMARRADGQLVPVRCTRAPFGHGQMLVALVDLRDLISLRSRLAHAERLTALGRLAGGLAQNFNNLLTSLRTSGEQLRSHIHQTSEGHDLIDAIDRSVDRGTQLTRQLLAFGRRQLLRARVIEPIRTVQGLQPMLEGLLNDDVVLRIEQPRQEHAEARVRLDPAQLEMSLVALVLNASDAMPNGGNIWIRQRLVDDDTVGLVVQDDGSGIDPEALPHVFDPFFTTKDGPTGGLGLASVHGFVTQSGGSVRVTSKPGEGTHVELRLPRVEEPAAPEPPPPDDAQLKPPADYDTGSGRILVVDDDELVLRVVRRALHAKGFDVHGVSDGHAALARLQLHPVDVLLTDVRMPGMNGAELAERATELHPHIAVVFMSGYTDDVLPDEAAARHGFVGKPFHQAELLAAVDTALQRCRSATATAAGPPFRPPPSASLT